MSNPSRRLAAPLVLLLLAGLAAGCTSDGDNEQPAAQSPSSSSQSSTPTPKPIRTKVSVANVVGKLPKDARRHLEHQVGAVVDGWFEAAYIGGKYPRQNFSHAFPGFTAGAKRQAGHDRRLMSNKALGPRISEVVATKRWVALDVLAPNHHPAAVTARFRLDFRTSGKARKQVSVRGRLFLTRGRHGWHVFGYDVDQGTPTEFAPLESGHHKAAGKKTGKKTGKKSHQHSRHHAKGGGR